ncbi:MAG: hypothetical protein II085_03460, partial [Alphaproteobacteria bacterium]|nr:hypothetical protein [Alphaproteobacteria bacterium]
DVLNSEDAKDVKLEKGQADDSLMVFTVNKDNGEPVIKMIVSKGGKVDVIADEDLSQEELEKYLYQINKNNNKFMDAVGEKAETALDKVGEILDSGAVGNIDLKSKEDVQKMVTRFVEAKEHSQLLEKIIYSKAFWRNFDFADKENRSLNSGSIKEKGIYFTYAPIKNSYYDGMAITVYDKNNNPKRGYLAKDSGEICSIGLDKKNKGPKHNVWSSTYLRPLTEEELDDDDIKYMFDFASRESDRIYRYQLKMLYTQNKNLIGSYNSVTPERQKYIDRVERSKLERLGAAHAANAVQKSARAERAKQLEEAQFQYNNIKLVKTYKLSDKESELINNIQTYTDRISKAYDSKPARISERLTEGSGFIRQTGVPGFIIDGLMPESDLLFGFGGTAIRKVADDKFHLRIFDKEQKEVARIVFTDNKDAELFVKNGADSEFVDSLVKTLKSEMDNGLSERLLSRLDDATFYHENYKLVEDFRAKSYNPLTISEVRQQLASPMEAYSFDSSEISNLKQNFEDVQDIYKEHVMTFRIWLEALYPEKKNYNTGNVNINGTDTNYEFSFIDNKVISGIKILTKDENGYYKNGYVISPDGKAHKFKKIPEKCTDPDSITLSVPSLIKLDENAVKTEGLDLIFNKICSEVSVLKDFMTECACEAESSDSGRLSHKLVELKADKYRTQTGNSYNLKIDEIRMIKNIKA